MAYPEPIDPADVTEGMAVTVTTTWADGSQRTITGTVTGVGTTFINTADGNTVDLTETGTTLQLNEAPPTDAVPPDIGTILKDSTGAAWQATGAPGSVESLTLEGIDGERLTWPEFVAAHPSYTAMQDTPVVPLPDPVSPYPQTITPDAARIGMDVRVTLTYAAGGQKVVRGVCVWVQDNDNTDGVTPDFLVMSLSTGDVFPYNPVPDGQTLTVEQMQPWTADSLWDISNVPEPPIGTVIRSRNGIAWQRISDAAADDPNPGVIQGKGRWFPVTQSFIIPTEYIAGGAALVNPWTQPVWWFWLWGAAAPFNVQEPV